MQSFGVGLAVFMPEIYIFFQHAMIEGKKVHALVLLWYSNSFEDLYEKRKVNAYETCSSCVFFVSFMPLVIVWFYSGVHIMFVVPYKF